MQGNIPVVQGFSVSSPNYANTSSSAANYSPSQEDYGSSFNYNGENGEQQPKKFNDAFFGILFYGHLMVMGFLLVSSLQGGYYGNGGGVDASGMIYFCSVVGIFATGLSTVTLGFMMSCASNLVKISLFFQLGCSLAMGILGVMSGAIMMAVLGFISFVIGLCYTYAVWDRIPFAAANLNTALTAVKANIGLAVVAYFFLFLGFGWAIWWNVVATTMMANYGGAAFLLFLSYYWTQQVLKNTVHVTTAGVIGTWWFAPHEASSCCSKAIGDSFTRATTYSFGSICFGSLLVAIVQALRSLNHQLRGNEDAGIIVCILDCILGCIESIIEYLNQWAYVYIGLYGYNYLDAGKNVMTLFQNKGWTVIITDNLVDNVLFMMSIVLGLLSGVVGMILTSLDHNLFAELGVQGAQDAASVGFFVAFLIGLVLSSILMSVVASAVNTIIVCFAEAPSEFEVNHPQLSFEMRNAWRQAWPNECRTL